MNEKRSFFDNLDPKSALIVGISAGFMGLCTIGFFVLGGIMLKGTIIKGVKAEGLSQNAFANNTAPSVASTQPPAADPSIPVAVPKTDKPQVDLFVMTHCPYGLQEQKAYIPVAELLNKKANMDVKFVSYAMHGKAEVDDNTTEYCIQKEQNDKYLTFLKCFTASANGDTQGCLDQAGINKAKLASCVAATDKQFQITAEYNNQSHWLSGQFPLYNVNKDENDKYGVQGSPTLVINGTQVEVARSPEAIKQAICNAFKNPPADCQKTLSTAQASPGFGTAQAAVNNAPAGGCGAS
jgi:protein-disulfide isomerase